MFEPKKLCTKCREMKYEGEFRLQGRRLSSWCLSCEKRSPEENRKYNTAASDKSKHTFLISTARDRARQKQLPFDLDEHRRSIKDRVYAGRCELTGLSLDLKARNAAAGNSPSIDRIKPELGYVYDNIRIICHALNVALGSWGEDQTAALMQAWLDKRNAV